MPAEELGLEEIIAAIVEKTSRNEKAVRQLVEEKKSRFAGLLSETGAGFLVAKELGVSIGNAGETESKISGLKRGMLVSSLTARITKVFPVREFEVKGEKAKMMALELKDDSGQIELALWRDQVKKYQELGAGIGSAVLLKNFRVSEYNGKPQISLSGGGQIIPVANQKGLPRAQATKAGIAGVREGMRNLEIAGKVRNIYPVREFVGANGKGRMLVFEFEDSGGKIRAVAWNGAVEQAKGLMAGDSIRIIGAYAKSGLDGRTELNLPEGARIELEEKVYVPRLEERKARREKLAAIREEELVEVRAEIAGVNRSRLFYLTCGKCNSKVTEKGAEKAGEFNCPKCGKVESAKPNAVISLELDDGTARIACTFFGSLGEQIAEKSSAELQSRAIAGGIEEVLHELRQKLVGKHIDLDVIGKKNLFRNELELVARRIHRTGEKETSKTLGKMGSGKDA